MQSNRFNGFYRHHSNTLGYRKVYLDVRTTQEQFRKISIDDSGTLMLVQKLEKNKGGGGAKPDDKTKIHGIRAEGAFQLHFEFKCSNSNDVTTRSTNRLSDSGHAHVMKTDLQNLCTKGYDS